MNRNSEIRRALCNSYKFKQLHWPKTKGIDKKMNKNTINSASISDKTINKTCTSRLKIHIRNVPTTEQRGL